MRCDSPVLAEYVGFGEPLKVYGSLERFMDLYSSPASVHGHRWMLLPCGHCLSCRLSHARMWSIRCGYELMTSDSSCFVTLTYNDAHLPDNGSLCKRDYQCFFKRLRKKLNGRRIRYFGCGEYGEKLARPHYHFIIYGYCPSDLDYFYSANGSIVYRSKFLQSIWPEGFVSVGEACEQSIKYVCRYVLKKIDWKSPEGKLPMFTCCSSRPAIGRDFFLKNWRDAIVTDGNGVILRYGFPNPFKSGEFLDVRYFRKLLEGMFECGDLPFDGDFRSSLVRFFASSNTDEFSLDDISRRKRFSDMRLSHNTHYGRMLPNETVEELLK